MPMCRDDILRVLDDAYTVYFDRMEAVATPASASLRATTPDQANTSEPKTQNGPVPCLGLAAAYAFHSRNEQYVLSKKVKLWSAETHEYAYVFSLPELNPESLAVCCDFARDAGLAKIRPHSEHMTSLITAVFVCDHLDDTAASMLKKLRFRKNFLFSLHGWMEFRAAALGLHDGTIVTNPAGKDLQNFLQGNLDKAQLRRSRN